MAAPRRLERICRLRPTLPAAHAVAAARKLPEGRSALNRGPGEGYENGPKTRTTFVRVANDAGPAARPHPAS
jgi:hypothetical protein